MHTGIKGMCQLPLGCMLSVGIWVQNSQSKAVALKKFLGRLITLVCLQPGLRIANLDHWIPESHVRMLVNGGKSTPLLYQQLKASNPANKKQMKWMKKISNNLNAPIYLNRAKNKISPQTICYIMYDVSMNRQRGENGYSPFFSCPNFTSTSYSSMATVATVPQGPVPSAMHTERNFRSEFLLINSNHDLICVCVSHYLMSNEWLWNSVSFFWFLNRLVNKWMNIQQSIDTKQ